MARQRNKQELSAADQEAADIERHMEAREDVSFDPAKLEPIQPQQPAELVTDIVNQVADSTRIPDTTVEAKTVQLPESLAKRDWKEYPDPNPKHGVKWEDGFTITFQESRSRHTIELQFGDGSIKDQPKAFAEIRQKLKDEGMKWNGTNAWVKELAPEVGSNNNRLRAREDNRRLRSHVEDVLFPQIIAIEEQARGEIPFSEASRNWVKAAAERDQEVAR